VRRRKYEHLQPWYAFKSHYSEKYTRRVCSGNTKDRRVFTQQNSIQRILFLPLWCLLLLSLFYPGLCAPAPTPVSTPESNQQRRPQIFFSWRRTQVWHSTLQAKTVEATVPRFGTRYFAREIPIWCACHLVKAKTPGYIRKEPVFIQECGYFGSSRFTYAGYIGIHRDVYVANLFQLFSSCKKKQYRCQTTSC